MNDVDLVIRLNHENAFVWWASKRFYSFIGDGQYKCTESQPLPRGYGLSHYAKYSNETTRINFDIEGTIYRGDSPTDGVAIKVGEGPGLGGNVNAVPTTFSLDALDARITAFISQDGNEISLVMFTPTDPERRGGFNLGTVKINMPEGFTIGSVQAHRSWGDQETQLMRPAEGEVSVSANRESAWVTLPRSNLLSVKFIRE
jgi:hypothetical protein